MNSLHLRLSYLFWIGLLSSEINSCNLASIVTIKWSCIDKDSFHVNTEERKNSWGSHSAPIQTKSCCVARCTVAVQCMPQHYSLCFSKHHVMMAYRNHNSSVKIVARLWDGRPGFVSRSDTGSSIASTPTPGPIQPPIWWAAWHEADYSLISCRFEMRGNIPSR
jgi:hypothetical protein